MTTLNRPILVVDDDEGFRLAVRALLEQARLRCVEAESGEKALVVLRDAQPSLVVLDVRLPGISGLEVCGQLRKEAGEDLPIIFVSGEKTDGLDRTAGLLVGADDYVVKPFEPGELLARVRRLMGRSRAHVNGPLPTEGSGASELTPREREVLQLLALGLDRSSIAGQLVISPKTVASHVQRLLGKLGVHSQMQAVALAYREHLIERPATDDPDVELAALVVETAAP
jgi:DNA-binding NarL/FixJ family response regulator